MKKSVAIFMFTVFSVMHIQAQTELKAGVRIQKAQKLYWENGFTVDYASSTFAKRKVHLGVSYVTTRLGSAIRSNAIKQDNLLVSAAYHFRSKKALQTFARFNTGYFRASYENPVFKSLPNSAILLSLDGGIYYSFQSPFTASVSVGYNLNSGSGSSGPGTLYPVFYQMSIYYTVLKGK